MFTVVIISMLFSIILVFVLTAVYNRSNSNDIHPEGFSIGQETELKCLRCFDTRMIYNGTERFHVGSNAAPFILGDIGELMVNRQMFDVYYCPSCGKAEFYYRKKKE